MNQPRSCLARHVPQAATTEDELKRMSARAWLDYGLLVVRPEHFADPVDAQMVRYLGGLAYGKGANG